MRLVATVARYHRGADPTAVHHPFAELSQDEQQRVVRLIALLRVAHALDRDHLQRVRDLQVRIGNSWVTLHLEATGGLLLEGWSLKKKSQLFADVFSRKVRLRVAGNEGEGDDAVS
jgi:exopolyphosphatase/guanosine-5'-triphosphate,3'-diphosphate pyrophosphatase